MQTIRRSGSVLTGCETEKLFSLKNFPVFMLEDDAASFQLTCDMEFEIGKEDGFVQLGNIIPPEILYKDTHSNAIGAVWEGMHRLVAETVDLYTDIDTKILEIGGGNGKLNAIYNLIGGKSENWDIIEVQPCPVQGCKARYRQGIFPNALSGMDVYDLIIHTHCMEHMEDLNVFFKSVCKHLIINGKMIFSVPDMQDMIKKSMTSIVNFEHTFLLTEQYIDYLLYKYGFQVDKKLSYGNGHSLVYVTDYTGVCKTISLGDMYVNNKILMKNFYERHTDQMILWNKAMDECNKKCYLFGAHITAQFFLCFGINIKKIDAILDNDPYKIGKRVCGIDKMVYSPEILRDQGSVVVMIPKTPYAEEIQTNILTKINPNVDFWMME